MLPTPIRLLSSLRIFYGTLDKSQFGAIAWADVNPFDFTLLDKSKAPVLERGNLGDFDDSGVVPTACLFWEDKHLLFYSGFQRTGSSQYTTFTGLAVSDDGAATFRRIRGEPVLGPSSESDFFQGAAFVDFDEPRRCFRMWYLSGTRWTKLANGKKVPNYHIRYRESDSPWEWKNASVPCLLPKPEAFEVGFSRPWVRYRKPYWEMFFAVRERITESAIAYTKIEKAISPDGIQWERLSDTPILTPSRTSWENEMVCYPAVFCHEDRDYLFYSGNHNGASGLGLVELGVRNRFHP